MADTTHCPGLLMLELGAAAPTGAMLPTEVASALVDHVASDLARLLPGAADLDLALSGALLDPAQVLRPGWPVFAELGAQLARHRRGAGGHVIAFGAAGGRMVSPLLEPDVRLGSGALMVLPFVLAGDAASAQRAGLLLEEILHEQGLASAAVALLIKQALDLDVVHARYFTHRDLAALVAIQLDHADCAPAWSLLEAALFEPQRHVDAVAASGQRWAWRDGIAHGAALGFASWRTGPAADVEPEAQAGAFAYWQAEQRRYAALFAAHGLAVAFVDGARGDAPLQQAWLLEAHDAGDRGDAPVLRAHEAPGLGAYAFSAVRGRRAIAACYPLAPDALPGALAALRECVGAAHDVPIERTRELPPG